VSIAADLRVALEITLRALDCDSFEQAERAVRERDAALERAAQAKRAGEAWGTHEQELAAELMATDRQLIDKLWSPCADAFFWLARRRAAHVGNMVHLRRLAEQQ